MFPSALVQLSLDRTIINLFVLYSLGCAQVINELVAIIQESLPSIVSTKQRHFLEKYEALALLYDLTSLDISCKCYYLPNITFIFLSK